MTSRRLGVDSLQKLVGVSSLPIRMNTSRVVHLYMVEAHRCEFGLVHKSALCMKTWLQKKESLVRTPLRAQKCR